MSKVNHYVVICGCGPRVDGVIGPFESWAEASGYTQGLYGERGEDSAAWYYVVGVLSP